MENILSTGARIVLAANAGCLLQIHREVRQHGHPLLVMHPMDLLDLSYRDLRPEPPHWHRVSHVSPLSRPLVALASREWSPSTGETPAPLSLLQSL